MMPRVWVRCPHCKRDLRVELQDEKLEHNEGYVARCGGCGRGVRIIMHFSVAKSAIPDELLPAAYDTALRI